MSQVEAVSSERLGERIRVLRSRSGLTLEGLSQKSGVSRAMISKLERGEKSPTLVVAAKLSEGLGVSLSRLVGEEEERRVRVIRAADATLVRDPETGFERRTLSPVFEGRGLEFVENTIPEGRMSPEFPAHRQGVVEYIVVESGRMTVELGDSEYDLGAGDSMFFEADTRHRFRNTGKTGCRYYLVIDHHETTS